MIQSSEVVWRSVVVPSCNMRHVLDTQPPTQLEELHGPMEPGSCHINRHSFISKEFDKTEHLDSKEVIRTAVQKWGDN